MSSLVKFSESFYSFLLLFSSKHSLRNLSVLDFCVVVNTAVH